MRLLALLVNGELRTQATGAVAADDRGLQYGDGLFETALLTGGKIRFWDDHWARLRDGCSRLRIESPDSQQLEEEVRILIGDRLEGVLKIIVTRGRGARGYRPAQNAAATRVLTLHGFSAALDVDAITVRWCTTRLGRNPSLAGIKHLNRLEQVMARLEWDDDSVVEGLMLDSEGELVCATSANVFAVLDNVLCTPDLRHCGVRGVMRGRVLQCAARLGISAVEKPLRPDDLVTASEVFLTNAVQGLRPIQRLIGHSSELRWTKWPVASTLRLELGV